MTIGLIVVLVPFMLTMPIYGLYMKKVQKKVSDTKAMMADVAEEALSNIRSVKAFATEDKESIKIDGTLEKVLKAELMGCKAYAWFTFFANGAMFGLLTALVFVAGWLHHKGVLEIGQFTTF